MRKFHSFAGILAIALLMLSSCSKETPPPTPDPKPELTKEEMLTGNGQKNWRLSKTFLDGTETTSSQKACTMDNNYTYKKDGAYQVTSGATKCDPSEGEVLETAEWWFNNEKTNINMKYTWNGQSMSFAYKIDELTENSLKVSMTYQGKVYTDHYTAQ